MEDCLCHYCFYSTVNFYILSSSKNNYIEKIIPLFTPPYFVYRKKLWRETLIKIKDHSFIAAAAALLPCFVFFFFCID